jgi:hypothetical protein
VEAAAGAREALLAQFGDLGHAAFTITNADGDASLIGVLERELFLINAQVAGSVLGQEAAFAPAWT